MRDRVTVPFVLLIVGLLVAAAPAIAQSPVQQVYGQQQVQSVVGGGGGGPTDVIPPPAAPRVPAETDDVIPGAPAELPSVPVERGAAPAPAVAEGSLPFTGFEATLVALAGLFLLGTGVAMRRVARTPA